MIFELLKCDLRSALSHYGLGKGLPLQTVQQYSKQIFLALRFLRKVKVIHGDVKPDNILMSLSKLEVKLCDFGSAMNVSETVATAYAQPRYYRSPEIMIGLPYDTQVDLWSAGVTLFELATGKILFTGKSNNAMIRQILEVSGKFSERMLKKGTCTSKHFNKDADFLLKDPDSITGEPEVLPAKRFFKAPRSVLSMMDKTLQDPPPNSARETQERLMPRAADLITKCTRPDPEDRFMPEHAVLHAFFNLDR
jgi:serine/threonine-protein kinase PRP4